MKKPPYTKKRGNIWWYRRPVPAPLRSIIGKVEFAWSLDTSDMAEARSRAAIRNAEVEAMLSAARAQLGALASEPQLPQFITPELLQYARDAVRAHVLREDEEVRKARIDHDSLDAYESIRADQFDDTGTALRTGRTERLRIDEALQAIGVAVPLRHPAREDVAYAVVEGHHSALLAIRERMNGEYVPTPVPPAKPLMLGPAAPAAEELTLGVVIDDYLVKQDKTPTEFTRKVRRCLQLFGEMVGRNTPVRDLKQKAVTDFLYNICELPNQWARRYDKGETIASMLAEDADKVMSPTTYEGNYRLPLGAFLTAALRDFGDDGFPARTTEGIKYSGNRQEGEDQQRALTPDELRTLYEGTQFAAVASDPEQEPLYWFAVVSLFTGARPRELCQANPQTDFGQEDGHLFLELSDSTAAGVGVVKSIKTGEERRIPMHSELVRLGFPEYVERLRKAGADRLFPSWGVKSGNAYKGNESKFTGLLKACGLYNNTAPAGKRLTGAYTLRKTFITQCTHQGVVSREMTGHTADDGTTAIQRKHYISGPAPLTNKVAQLAKLVMPANIPKRG